MLEDSDNGKDEPFPKERERTPLALAKEREQEKMVRNHQVEQTHRKFKVGPQQQSFPSQTAQPSSKEG